MINVCNECCQIIYDSKCKCNSNLTSEKKIGLVNGCIYYDTGIRCKKDRLSNSYVCKIHKIIDTKYYNILYKK